MATIADLTLRHLRRRRRAIRRRILELQIEERELACEDQFVERQLRLMWVRWKIDGAEYELRLEEDELAFWQQYVRQHSRR